MSKGGRALPSDLWRTIYGYNSRETTLPPRAWQTIEEHLGPRTPQEELTRRSLKRRSCSPCNVLLREEALTEDDEPFDTAVCDHTCHGRWSVALGRLAEAVIRAAGHYGFAREVAFRLQLGDDDCLLTFRAARGEQTMKLHSVMLLQRARFVKGKMNSKAKDGLLWGDLVFLDVDSRYARGNAWTQEILVPSYSLRYVRTKRPTTKRGSDAAAVPYDGAFQDNNVDVGYSFREKHVRMFARRNTGAGKQRYRDPKSSQTWVYDQSRGRDWLRHAWWEDSPEARQVL